jgi:hypothetical protein
MRPSLSLLIMAAWAAVPIAQSQTAAIQPVAARSAAAQPAAAQPAAVPLGRSGRAHPSPHAPLRRGADAARRSTAAGKSAGVVDLGATDITGNKELPKVMVIVPWKDSLGATGVVKPTDSLLDEVLQPVDRGVFQRQIHYYGQLKAAEERPAAGKVAPVGDSR